MSPPTRIFNGREVAFLTGAADDTSRVVHSTKQGVGPDGYEVDLVVVAHPDGKFYEFEFRYNTEYGIVACLEDPDGETEAFEVQAVQVTKTVYRRK